MASTPVPMNAGVAQATNPYMSYDQIMRNRAGALNAGGAGPAASAAQPTVSQPPAAMSSMAQQSATQRQMGVAPATVTGAAPAQATNAAPPRPAPMRQAPVSPQTNRNQFAGMSRGNRYGNANVNAQGRASKVATNPADKGAAYQRAMSRVSS